MTGVVSGDVGMWSNSLIVVMVTKALVAWLLKLWVITRSAP